MKARLGWRCRDRAGVCPCHRIHAVPVDAPAIQRANIDLVEGLETLFGEWRGRVQFAGAERRSRAPDFLQECFDAPKALGQRDRCREAHALNAPPRQRRDAPGVLEHTRNVAVAPGREGHGCVWHGLAFRSMQWLLATTGAPTNLVSVAGHGVARLRRWPARHAAPPGNMPLRRPCCSHAPPCAGDRPGA